MKRCPLCGNDTFYVTAHVTQGWLVDDGGNYLETTSDCEVMTHSPDDIDVWECSKCGYNDKGAAFNVSDQKEA